MLQLFHFRKTYGQRLILDIPELELPEGIHWFKGANGSGKTTLFKSIAGLIPFKGEVALNGISIHREPVAYRRLVNFSEAEPLYPQFLTARDLISFIGKAKGASEEQIKELSERLGLVDYQDNVTGTYSSGMLKKLSLLTGFLGEPKLIILDEPLITIDRQARAVISALIREYRSRGVSFLLSSHEAFKDEEISLSSLYQIREQSVIKNNSLEQPQQSIA